MIEEIAAALPGRKDGKGFTLREGIRFGMRPEDVIREEASRGFKPWRPLTFNGMHHILSFETEGKDLAGLPLSRFEYDFAIVQKPLYQFTYMFGKSPRSIYFPLSLALQKEYGLPNNHIGRRTVCRTLARKDSILTSQGWIFRNRDKPLLLIDLWQDLSGNVSLTFQTEGV